MKDRINDRIEYLQPDESQKKALIDLSVSGAAFNCSAPENKGNKIQIKIKEHTIEAVVVYSQESFGGFRIGLQFKNVVPEVQKALKLWIDEFSRGVPLTCEILDTNEKGKT